MKILAFSGSLRTGSYNTKLLKVAVPLLEQRGATVDVWDMRAANIGPLDPDIVDGNPPAAVVDFKNRIRAAAGLLIVSPEYNYSIPGHLKNVIDWASRPPKENPFKGRVVAQMGATIGMGGTLQMQIMLRHVMVGLECISVPRAFTLSKAAEQFDEHEALKDEAQKKMLNAYLDTFVAELKLHVR